MEYAKIIAVTGLPGLFELVSSKSDGAIVRSLDDKTSRFVSSRVHNFSHLESIEIYTTRDNVNLVDVFNAMEKAGEKLPDGKDNNALKKYFELVYPDIDFERVYTSDMKKMVKWFSVLKENNVEIKLSEIPEEEPAEEVVEEKPAEEKKPAKKAEAKPAKEVKEKETKEKEPAKKAAKPAAAAKKETEKKAAPAKKTATKAAKEEPKKEAPAKKKAAPKKKSK